MVLLYKRPIKLLKKLLTIHTENKVSKIIVVTGKGLHSNVEKDPYVSKDLSILKYSVPEFIENNTRVNEKNFRNKRC